MRLNGWQRLWVCLSLAWTGIYSIGAYAWWASWLSMLDHGFRTDPLPAIAGTLLVWTLPPALMYALAWAIGWIRRGFTQKER